jgi:hypothetical protein
MLWLSAGCALSAVAELHAIVYCAIAAGLQGLLMVTSIGLF